MRKLLFLLSLTLFSAQLHADSYFSDLYEEVCQDKEIKSDGSLLICHDSENMSAVISAKPDFDTVADTSQVELWDIVEMGVMPDDSTDHIYNYKHPLLDVEGEVVGYLQVIAATNSEWDGEGIKLINRYDLNGQIVTSKAQGI
ncbi:MAG: hypothetical protein CL677_09755 [Bdellovibrionaceae bacterium]|nr:hypothetical protein [Pseudobdellovibrionaceae bacterium]|tara:strand:+ start:61703 stop:62131 length:429 start_codon:yes stop_codon:yes gene_type:complete